MHSRDEDYDEAYDDAVLGISLPPIGKNEYRDSYLRSAAPAGTGLLPSLDTHHAYSMRNFTPPVPGLSHSATPSSRHTESPYSHVPTPSSASSYSSGLVTTSAQDPKYSSNSPLRPRQMISATNTNTNDASTKALPPVRESSTSSSNSTVKLRQPQSGSKVPVSTLHGAPSNAHTSASGRRLSSTHRKSINTAIPAQLNTTIPPELAHLNVDAPLQPNIHANHPRRPSRDQTPSLNNLKGPSPVVHSDLPRLYTTYHKRTPSQDTIGSATSTSLRGRFGFSPRSSSKQASPRVDSAFSPASSSTKTTRLQTPDSARSDRPRLLRKDSPAVDQSLPPAPPSKSPRFSFMSRKSKSNSEKSVEKPKRDAVKGPVAGTGHEKYGRFAFRGRSSNGTTNSFSRSSSASSSASGVMKAGSGRKGSTTSDESAGMDEFLRDRLSPVVLRGGNGIPFGTRTEIWAEKGEESSSSQSLENVPRPQLLPSAMARDHSVSSVRGSPDQNEHFGGEQAGVDSQNAPRHHDHGAFRPAESLEGKEGLWLRPLQNEKPVPRLKHKWNFFQRAQSSQNSGDLFTRATGRSDNEPASVHGYQDALHLGILDAVEPVDLAEVERIIQEHDKSDADASNLGARLSRAISSKESGPNNRWSSLTKATSRESDNSDARRLSPSVMANMILTESPELLKARTAVPQHPRQVVRKTGNPLNDFFAPPTHSPEVLQTLATPELVYETNDTPETPLSVEPPRQPRLSPVGRIPTVVSKRDRDRRLPDNSFSRPFASSQPRPTARPPGSLYNQIRDLASPTDSGSQPVSSTSGRSDSISVTNQSSINADQPSASTGRSSIEFYAGNDFILFAPRKNSDVSHSSSGSSNWVLSSTARAPEEDIWSEYNDLMDDVMPDKTPISAGSSHGVPFQYASMLHHERSPTMPAPLRVERSASLKTKDITSATPAIHKGGRSSACEDESMLRPVSPMAPAEYEAVAVAASQRDDRFTSPPVSPLTPDTLAHFVGTYGDRSTYSSDVQNRLSVPQHRSSLISPRGSTSSSRYSVPSVRHSRSASVPEISVRHSQASIAPSARRNRDTQLLDIPEHDTHKKFTTSDLRFGALMTSKWLTFGRVLFSPAHHEVRLAEESRILVIDGLGDDWSHYVATSYPNAIVYNLAISTSNNSGSSGWGPLTNYRHFNHPSLSTPLPFPRGFFAAVVFRFPMAAREHEYQACILESKRVLRPGGHLEVVALDIDMMNMGTRGRRALRGLKTRIQQGDQDVSLGNLSDTLVRMIGRRGFEEVQRCVVGVPAAGRIPRSDDVRSSSCSSTSTGGIPHKINNISAAQRQDEDVSFANLLQKNRQSQIVEPGRANDEGITKMVARVGRWWYSMCYEQPLLETDKSVWQERGLLRECEKQGTSFRLLICCAQKPLQARRRTKSV